MSTLREERCYGLSCRTLNHGRNISVFHVKLTDSAARAFDGYQNSKGLSVHPSICFTGSQGRMSIPCSESSRSDLSTFTFSLTNVGRDNPQGSFDCVHQHSTGDGGVQLSSVGVIQEKMTVNATDDSYNKARQSLAMAEEETRSRGAIVIKHRGRNLGKRVRVRNPVDALADIAPSRQSSRPVLISSSARKGGGGGGSGRGVCVFGQKKSACVTERKGACISEQRPLKERLTHLLALKPYKRPDLVVRLQKEGLTTRDRDMLDTLLLQVGYLNSRDNTYTLKDSLYKDLQKNWSGYTTGDQQLLKRILVRKLCQPQNLLSVPETQVSPLRDTPNSSPAQRQPIATEYTDPLANKKPRISHMTSKPINGKLSLSSSKGREAVQGRGQSTMATEDISSTTSLDPPQPFDRLSEVGDQNVCVAECLGLKGSAPITESHPGLPTSHTQSPHVNSIHSIARRKSKHRQRDKGRVKGIDRGGGGGSSTDSLKSKASFSCTERDGMFYSASVHSTARDMTDYLLKYTVICNREQRLSYKQDFNVEYSEYRGLHARIDGVTRQFTNLDTQRKQMIHGTHKYKSVHNKILQEYRKIKKLNPNYKQDRIRCEYLHNKLAHIKRLISQYDQQQLKD